jgi:hypothetical protein
MPEPFQPGAIIRTLGEHGVRHVVVGGLAGVLHGAPVNTNDADICPDPDPENLDRLAAALREMDARIRTHAEPDGVAFAADRHVLARMAMLNLVTRYGDFDISFKPAATEGFPELVEHAVDYDVNGTIVKVAALDDVIRSKETANRPKDQRALPILYALRDELAKRRENEGE